jgi:hypothetical protein
MKNRYILNLFIISGFCFVSYVLRAKDQADNLAPNKEIVSVSELGINPENLTLKGSDGSVFFLNRSKSDFFQFKMKWGKRRAHCASPNLKINEEDYLVTQKPIKPNDFIIACFPELGDYSYEVSVGSKKFLGVIQVSAK